jgi:orotidine-5'-phosphate decarboxylase
MGLLLNDKDNLDPIAKKETDAFLQHGRDITNAEANVADMRERIPDINENVAPFRPRKTTIVKPGVGAINVESNQPQDVVHKQRLQRALTARKAFLGY